jgi:hypothetical protein
MIDIFCAICFERISQADPDELCVPLMGSMFKSPDPHHGVPDPFPPDQTWEDFKCPVCRHRPFIDPGQVLTRVEDSIGELFEPMFLDYCGLQRASKDFDEQMIHIEPETANVVNPNPYYQPRAHSGRRRARR